MRHIHVVIFLMFSLVSTPVFAVTDEFTVKTLIGNADTTPPSIPDNVLATSVTSSQIDISWDASTDNFLLSGYQVFRGGSHIATTTLTSYSDTGLSSSTIYTYTITAFDSSYNYSTTSTASATSTLGVTATTTTPVSPGQGATSIESIATELSNLEISTAKTTAEISFDTNVYTSVLMRWGRTINYEMGYISSDIFKKNHQTFLTGLEPGTTYEFEIILSRKIGDNQYIKTVQFTTESASDVTAPTNVLDLNAIQQEDAVAVSWTNPIDADFSHVRVVSSELFYPTDPLDGWFVYEGNNTAVIDTRAVFPGRRYYTVFSYDTNGNISSGAVAYLDREFEDESSVFSTTTDPEIIPPSISLDFDDVYFVQDGDIVIKNSDDIAVLNIDKNTTITVSYDLLPENLKTIVMTMVHPEDDERVFSFLLKINKERTAYEALIGNLPQSGIYKTVFELFDYSTRKVTRIPGEVIVETASVVDDLVQKTLVQKILSVGLVIVPLVSLLLFFWWWFVIRTYRVGSSAD